MAHQLIHDDKNPIYNQSDLKSEDLDYSVESLHLISTFLINSNRKNLTSLNEENLTRFIQRVGAYVGETVRRNDKNRTWYWLEYDDVVNQLPQIGEIYPRVSSRQFVLSGVKKNDSTILFSFPMNNVIKNLANGDSDSVYNFATLHLEMDERMKNQDASK
jgi:hypothetical protein